MSTMRFVDGPICGTECEPHDGFPAPDKYRTPDGHWYARVEVLEGGVHVYQYEKTETQEATP